MEVGCSVHNFRKGEDGTYQELPSDFYYNLETIQFGELGDRDLEEYLRDHKETFHLTVYGDADVKPAIEKALEGRTYGDTLEGIADDVVKALSGAEFSIEADGFSYSTYEKAVEQDGKIVCLRGNESVTPGKVVDYDVTVADYDWNLWVCAAQEEWYR
ncbi:MAG: hypothetical protein NC548_25295 [Lachnospiraceae bacterium]|nr:hypothetical protein [Lachnospiraceae bacterium]